MQITNKKWTIVFAIALLLIIILIYILTFYDIALRSSSIEILGNEIRIYSITAFIGLSVYYLFTSELLVKNKIKIKNQNLVWGSTAILSIIGGRGYLFLTEYSTYSSYQFFDLSSGGVSIVGVVIAALICVVVFHSLGLIKTQLSKMLLILSLGISLSQPIGRLGNYFNQELYGLPSNLPWAMNIEEAYRVAGYTQYATFHPLFLYESILNIILFVLMIHLISVKRFSIPVLLSIFWICYGLIRFILDFIRIEGVSGFMGFSYTQWLILASFLFILLTVNYAKFKKA